MDVMVEETAIIAELAELAGIEACDVPAWNSFAAANRWMQCPPEGCAWFGDAIAVRVGGFGQIVINVWNLNGPECWVRPYTRELLELRKSLVPKHCRNWGPDGVGELLNPWSIWNSDYHWDDEVGLWMCGRD